MPNFIRRFAVQSKGSVTLHVIHGPFGHPGFSICGTTNAPQKGWIKPSVKIFADGLYCSACMNRVRLMYEDKDPRLTTADRERFGKILAQVRLQ